MSPLTNVPQMQPAGYSGTPLAKKLGIKGDFHIDLINAPEYYLCLFADLPANLYFKNDKNAKIDLIHFFTKSQEEYKSILPQLKSRIKPNGSIWVSWPKKSSKVPHRYHRRYHPEFCLAEWPG